MTIAATYLDDLSRVRLVCSGAPAAADYALIERSSDGGITWATVRGADTVALTASGCTVDDYEFAPGVLNTYRAAYVDSAAPTFVAPGAAVTGDNASLSPAYPAGIADGDLALLFASIRNDTATVNTPAGWTLWIDAVNVRVFVGTYVTGALAPTVTFSGGVAGDDTIAQIGAARNVSGSAAWLVQAHGAQQNIPMPALAAAELRPNLMVRFGWKADDSTGSSMAGWTLIDRTSTTTGADATQLWYQRVGDLDATSETLTVTGGASAISKAVTLRLTRAPYRLRETTSITPGMDRIWLKHPQRPYLNRPVTVTDWSDVVRPARSGVFDVVGRSYPVAVTELRGSRRYTLTVTVPTLEQATDLDGCLSAGEPVLLHVPAGCPVPGMYAVVGETQTRRPTARRSARRYLDLPLTEIAAPAGTLVGSAVTWQGVLSSFATWSDVLAAEPTWSDLLDRIGTPGDVIVP